MELWRPLIEDKAGGDLAKLAGALRDQKAFARLTRTMLNHLALGDQSDSDPSSDENAEGENPEGENDEGDDAQQDGESAATESAADSEDGEQVDSEAASEQSEDLSDATEPEDGAKPQRHEAAFRPSG